MGENQKHIHWSLDTSNLRWLILFCAQYFPLNLLLEYIFIIIINILCCYVQYFLLNEFYFSIEYRFLYAIYIMGPRRRWADNIRMDLQEVGCVYGDWIGLAQDRDRWRTLVSVVMNLRVP